MKEEFKHIGAYDTEWLQPLEDACITMPVLHRIANKTTNGIEVRGMENVDFSKPCFFMTNHRDIVLDAAFLSMILHDHHISRPYIGIGNNLFGKWWIEPYVRSNRVFVVIRDGSIKDLLKNSQTLSQYIRYVQQVKHGHIWMAQREGRAKDSNDRTQPAVLKMLTLSDSKLPFLEAIAELNICPVSISYEYDPCDFLKAWEMQQKRDHPGYVKTREFDILNMKTGIEGQKGRVVFTFTPSINSELQNIAIQTSVRNEQIQLTAELIDKHIHANYEIFDTPKLVFETYIEHQTDKAIAYNNSLQEGTHEEVDRDFIREKMLEMYATPQKNKMKV